MSLRIERFLGTALATTVSTTATQIFSTPARQDQRTRTGFQITNCDSGNDLYVSNASDLSTTNFWYLLAAGETKYIPWEANVQVWILGSAADTDYRAQEVIAFEHRVK